MCYSNRIWSGDPHPTGDDPIHVSGVIGKRSLKGKNRVTSFHAYPNGVVKFSNKSLPIVQVDITGNTASRTASGTASGTTSGSGVSEAQTECWTWSLDHDDYYHWNDDGSCIWYKASSNAASSTATPRETEHNGGKGSNGEGGERE